ncbi:MAG: host attachment protein [Gammaproteobacteria bacterium]|nr:host attachment protein [Gammaproteobacteria bacterium]
MSKDWIAVADRSRCRIFAQETRYGPLQEVLDLVSSNGSLKNQEINSDRHGRAFDSSGQGRHAMSSSVDPASQEAIRFAKDVSTRLDAARKKGRFTQLYVIAEPRFLGHLRAAFNRPLQEVVAAEIDKDWTSQTSDQIRQRMRAALFG